MCVLRLACVAAAPKSTTVVDDRIVSGRCPGHIRACKIAAPILKFGASPAEPRETLADFRDCYERNAKIRSVDRTSGCGQCARAPRARAGSARLCRFYSWVPRGVMLVPPCFSPGVLMPFPRRRRKESNPPSALRRPPVFKRLQARKGTDDGDGSRSCCCTSELMWRTTASAGRRGTAPPVGPAPIGPCGSTAWGLSVKSTEAAQRAKLATAHILQPASSSTGAAPRSEPMSTVTMTWLPSAPDLCAYRATGSAPGR